MPRFVIVNNAGARTGKPLKMSLEPAGTLVMT